MAATSLLAVDVIGNDSAEVEATSGVETNSGPAPSKLDKIEPSTFKTRKTSRPAQEKRTAFALLSKSLSKSIAWATEQVTEVTRMHPWEEVSVLYVNKAFYLLVKENPMRRAAIRLVTYTLFDWAMLAIILCNCVVLALDSQKPGFQDSDEGSALKWANIGFLVIFSLEALVKITAYGLVAGPKTYLRDGWNILDMFIVASGWIELLNLGNYSALRTIRILRALRTIARVRKLKELVTTILASIPMLLDVVLLLMLFYVVFGAISLEIFGKGALRGRCADPSFDNATTVMGQDGNLILEGVVYTVAGDQMTQVCRGPQAGAIVWLNNSGVYDPTSVHTGLGWDCNWHAGEDPLHPNGMFCANSWNPSENAGSFRHFDNVMFSSLTMFLFISTQDWALVMYDVQDGVSQYIWPIPAVMLILGGIFITNLFLAVLYIQFSRHGQAFLGRTGRTAPIQRSASIELDKEESEAAALSAFEGQIRSSVSGIMGPSIQQRILVNAQENSLLGSVGGEGGRLHSSLFGLSWNKRVRLMCYRIQLSRVFNVSIMTLIVLNAFLMALIWYDMPNQVLTAFVITNFVFTSFFLIELAIKLLGLGVISYFSSYGNWFDTIVTLAGVAEMLVELSPASSSAAHSLTALRAMRLLRLFRLSGSWKGLQRVVNAFAASAGSIAWLTLLLFFFLFVGSLIGMQLFGYQLNTCDAVPGSSQQCFKLDVTACPSHFDCYLPCNASDAGAWFNVSGSPYNGLAYCETISTTRVEFWAQAGKSSETHWNFDDFWQAFLTLFQVLTLDNYDSAMYETMAATSAYAAFYFITMMTIGRFMVLNLFLAILLDGFVGLENGSSLDPEPSFSSVHGDHETEKHAKVHPTPSTEPLGEAARGQLAQQGSWTQDAVEAPRQAPQKRPGASKTSPGRIALRRATSRLMNATKGDLIMTSSGALEAPAVVAVGRAGAGPVAEGRARAGPVAEGRAGGGPVAERRAGAGHVAEGRAGAGPVAEGHAGAGHVAEEHAGAGHVAEGVLHKADALITALQSIQDDFADMPPSTEGALRDGDTLTNALEAFGAVPSQVTVVPGSVADPADRVSAFSVEAASSADQAADERFGPGSLLGFHGSLQARQASSPFAAGSHEAQEQPSPDWSQLKGVLRSAGSDGQSKVDRNAPGRKRATIEVLDTVDEDGEAAAARAHHDGLRADNDEEVAPSRWLQFTRTFKSLARSIARRDAETEIERSEPAILGPDEEDASKKPAGVPGRGVKRRVKLSRSDFQDSAQYREYVEDDPFKVSYSGASANTRVRQFSTITDSAVKFDMRRNLITSYRPGYLFGTSLLLFGPRSWLRGHIAEVVSSRKFDHVLLLAILGSCVVLAMETPTLDSGTSYAWALRVCDLVFASLFLVEAVMKVIAAGFLFNGPMSYLRRPWNILDFSILIMSIVILTLDYLETPDDILWLRAFRAARALRSLRAASRLRGVQIVVGALFKAIPEVGNVALVAILFFFIFAVLSVNLLVRVAGRMSMCVDDAGNTLDPYYFLSEDGNVNKTWCQDGLYTVTNTSYHDSLGVAVPIFNMTGYRWVTPLRNFDNFAASFWVLFTMSLGENWSEVMYLAADNSGLDQQPIFNAWLSGTVFFIFFMIICSFFVLNLVISVSIDKFKLMMSKDRENSSGSFLLTEDQRQWLTIQKMLADANLQARYSPPSSRMRLRVFKLVLNRNFDYIITAVVLLNATTLLAVHHNMGTDWSMAIKASNVAFTFLYLLEFLLKWLGLGLASYLRVDWNRFDLVVLVISLVDVLVTFLVPGAPDGLQLLRLLRVARVFKLVSKLRGLRAMFQTFVWSLPALFNVSVVMLVLMYIYAVIGMNLFGNMVHGEGLTIHANFEDFPHAMQTLFTSLTGENWDYIMRDCMQLENCILIKSNWTGNTTDGGPVSVAAGSYLDPTSDLLHYMPSDIKDVKCSPAPMLSVIFFCSYMVLITLLMLQLIVGVILDNIQLSSYTEQLLVTQTHITQFVELWEELDPDGTSFIHATNLLYLLGEVDFPLGVRGAPSKDTQGRPRKASLPLLVQEVLLSCDIPIRNNFVHFMETLHALAGRVAGTVVPESEEYEIHSKMVLKIPKEEKKPLYTAMHFYAAMSVQVAIRGFMLRRNLEPLVIRYDKEFSMKMLATMSSKRERAAVVDIDASSGSDDEGNASVVDAHEKSLSEAKWRSLQALVVSRMVTALTSKRKDKVPSWPTPSELEHMRGLETVVEDSKPSEFVETSPSSGAGTSAVGTEAYDDQSEMGDPLCRLDSTLSAQLANDGAEAFLAKVSHEERFSHFRSSQEECEGAHEAGSKELLRKSSMSVQLPVALGVDDSAKALSLDAHSQAGLLPNAVAEKGQGVSGADERPSRGSEVPQRSARASAQGVAALLAASAAEHREAAQNAGRDHLVGLGAVGADGDISSVSVYSSLEVRQAAGLLQHAAEEAGGVEAQDVGRHPLEQRPSQG